MGMIVMAILAPLAATIIQMAISRSREYKADAGAAQLTHNPEGLASALEKLTAYSKTIAACRPRRQTAHLFIVSPAERQEPAVPVLDPPAASRSGSPACGPMRFD